jgi:hypothetical protein
VKLRIWKYPIPEAGRVFSPGRAFPLPLPGGATVLDVQVQEGVPVIWALVETETETVTRFFVVYGTGHPVEARHQRYVGTFQLQADLVFHLFELL